ncbi:MAG: helix-turn-helix transcriptional regulator [Lentisphaeria bacterium]|nr:helix-turn-helix transcriptional regulator [Lentisphaeria bacterium]
MDEDILISLPQITTFRVLEYDNRYATTEHVPASHELLYVLDGKITLHLKEQLIFYAVPGDFLIVEAGTPHRDEFALLKGLRIMLLQFKWKNRDFFKTVNNLSLSGLSYDVRNEARRRLDFLRSNWEDSPEGLEHAAVQLHGILHLFYFDLQKKQSVRERSSFVPLREAVQRAKHFIDQNYAEPLSLKQIAGYVGISPAYLSRMFHHEYGVSFSAYLTARRLEISRELLLTTHLQVAEIAVRCGFSSSSYFIKVFSEHFHTTPGNYAGRTSAPG